MKTYTVDTPAGSYVTHRPPVDPSTPETWAASVLELIRAVNAHGLGTLQSGEPYDLGDFLADSGADMPWDRALFRHIHALMVAAPDFAEVMTAFRDRFGEEFLPADGSLPD
jgi:hypothetical protein